MQRKTWAVPEFEEINLGSEIGTYYEDEEDPSFSFIRSLDQTGIRRRPYALERRIQRSKAPAAPPVIEPPVKGLPCR